MKTRSNRFGRDSALTLAALFLDSDVNEYPFLIGSFAGTKAREIELDRERTLGKFKYFKFDDFMNEHPFSTRGSELMQSEFEDGHEDSLAEICLAAVSLGLETNERPVDFHQLRDRDRATVPRPGRRLGAMSVHVGATGGAR